MHIGLMQPLQVDRAPHPQIWHGRLMEVPMIVTRVVQAAVADGLHCVLPEGWVNCPRLLSCTRARIDCFPWRRRLAPGCDISALTLPSTLEPGSGAKAADKD